MSEKEILGESQASGSHPDDAALERSLDEIFEAASYLGPTAGARLAVTAMRLNKIHTVNAIRARDALQEATTDPLTGLPNRKGLDAALAERVVETARYSNQQAAVFIDLDGFKALNDSLGHEAGDFALQEVAGRLHSAFRKTDFIGRYGGDEFVMLLRYDEIETFDPETVREKIRGALDGLVYWKGDEAYPIGASVGFGSINRHGRRAIEVADADMYTDKKGKNRRMVVLQERALSSRFSNLTPELEA